MFLGVSPKVEKEENGKMATDLTPLINTWRSKDVTWNVEFKIERLYARQDPQYTMWYQLPEKQTIAVTNKEVTKEKSKKRSRTTSVVKSEEKEIPFRTFPRSKDGKNLLIPFGGHFGILDTTLRQVCKEIKSLGYKLPKVALVTIEPEWFEVPLEDVKDKLYIDIVSETRHSKQRSGEKVRADIAYEVIKDINIPCTITSNGVAPLEDDEMAQILHALETAKFGPTKRGKVKVVKFEKVD